MPNTKVPIELSSTPGIIDNSTVTAITIDSAGAATFSGDVGIGTSSPATNLHIQSASEPAITLFHTGIMASQIGLDSTGSLTFGIDGSTGATERMRISGGNLGLGTSSPVSFGANTSFFTANGTSNGNGYACQVAGTNYGFMYASTNLLTIAAEGASTPIAFATNNATRMVLDTSGRLVINGASYSQGTLLVKQKFDGVYGGLVVESLVNDHFLGLSHDSVSDCFVLSPTYNTTGAYKPFAIHTSNAERLRVDTSGNLLVGTSTATARLTVDSALSSGETIRADNSKANYGGANIYSVLLGSGNNSISCGLFQGYSSGTVRFLVAGNGAVYGNGTFGTYSDLKLKENIVDANSQWDDIKAVQLKNYSMKEDSLSEANQLGVIAQDLEASGMQKLIEEMDDKDVDGNLLGTTTKHVKYSVLHLKALGALQEAMTRIETLEARLATLEGA